MDELRAGGPLVVGKITLVPVERTSLRSHAGERGCWLSARKEACAVVVRDSGGVRAFDAQAAEIPVDSLIRDVPGLGAVLAAL